MRPIRAISALNIAAAILFTSALATNALLLGYLYRPSTAHAGFIRLTYVW